MCALSHFPSANDSRVWQRGQRATTAVGIVNVGVIGTGVGIAVEIDSGLVGIGGRSANAAAGGERGGGGAKLLLALLTILLDAPPSPLMLPPCAHVICGQRRVRHCKRMRFCAPARRERRVARALEPLQQH